MFLRGYEEQPVEMLEVIITKKYDYDRTVCRSANGTNTVKVSAPVRTNQGTSN